MIRKLLIANRGEIVGRIARTCRQMGIRSVAVYSDADEQAAHVEVCDEAIRIGGDTPATSYLRGDVIIAAARRVSADAIHPGFGFLAENADFARAVGDAGLTWVGPGPEVIATMGDKLEAKRVMADAGVPVLPTAELQAGGDAAEAAAKVGFPLMVKAAAGGGGKGMRVVRDPAVLVDEVAAARREAQGAFGDDRVFLERLVERSRHVEVQIFGDVHDTVIHLFERECSIQRRHQKVIEECPSPGIDDDTRHRLLLAAVAAGRALGYVNAGTVEFLVDDATGDVWFLEVNTRLQVEHAVTEAVTGLDLVRLQLLVAAGEPLPLTQEDVVVSGQAIEARLYAEDPASDYLPASGQLHTFRPGTGVRWDTGIRQGDSVSPFYDPMLAKVIAHAPTRPEAAMVLARALEQTLIQGIVTNRDLLVHVLRDTMFLAGDTTTDYLDRRFPDDAARTFPPSPQLAEQAAVVAAIAGLVRASAEARAVPTIPRRFSNTTLGADPVTFTVGGHDVIVSLEARRDGGLDVIVNDRRLVAHEVTWDEEQVDVELDGHRVRARIDSAGTSVQVVLPDGNVTLHHHPRFPGAEAVAVTGATVAPMPGSVVAVAVAEGQEVVEGELLVIVEAMKMEHRIVAPTAGIVAEVRVVAGQQVDADDILVVVTNGSDETAPGGR